MAMATKRRSESSPSCASARDRFRQAAIVAIPATGAIDIAMLRCDRRGRLLTRGISSARTGMALAGAVLRFAECEAAAGHAESARR